MTLNENLLEFGEDLVLKAKKGKLDDAICRDEEIERIIEVLARRKKNNVLLLGEPGVGKTSIVEGIAKKIANNQTNKVLDKKTIYSLDYHYLVSGTMYRGQLEERVTQLIKEIKKNKNIILFIDEIHTIFSNKTGTTNSTDLNNFLKPYLSSGEVQIIGITTYDEYSTSINKDKALDRRFQKIIVNPTSFEDTVKILKNVYPIYEKYHNVKFNSEIIEECVKLASRYIFDRQLPDSAIDILDETGSIISLNNKNTNIPKSSKIDKLKTKLSILIDEKNRRIKNEEFDNILELKKQLDDLKFLIEKEKDKWYKSHSDKIPFVTINDVYKTISKITNIEPDHFNSSYINRIDNFYKNTKKLLHGQDDALNNICKVLKRKVFEINENKPLASFLLPGPSGVGKTSMAKYISKYIFATDMVRIDMSEFSDINSISKLIGSAPGYVGYEEGGVLTEAIKRNPHTVILFDEVEKAHKDIFNVLLQILDEGHVKDSKGRMINFKHSIIILTSNLGVNIPEKVGFNKQSGTTNDQINKFFRVEFLNRLDMIVKFKHLQKQDMLKIYNLELEKIKTKLEKFNISIKVLTKLKNHILETGFDKKFGARFLQRTMYKCIIDPILEKFDINGNIELDYVNEEIKIKID